MDGSPLTRKFAYGRQSVIQERRHFTKCGLPCVIPPAVCLHLKETGQVGNTYSHDAAI